MRIEPLNPLLCADAAEVALALGDRTRAAKYLHAGRKDFGSYGPLAEQAGYLALSENRHQEAVELLVASETMRSDPGMSDAATRYAGLSAAFFHLGNMNAVDHYAPKALEFAPEATPIRLLYAHALEAREEWENAIMQYSAVLRYDPGHEPARMARDRARRTLQELLAEKRRREQLPVRSVSRGEN